ncbi:MAG TPA: hypothetical protein VHY84_19320 [Bryobacteraceae bacterium]|jgi:hypothetical protein|nr:hypothetical protein [Bryobacteraceae bacterium]
MAEILCPFFARSIIVADAPGVERFAAFVDNPGSNQCALIMTAASPCVMHGAGEEPAWGLCLRNPANNGSYDDHGFPAAGAPVDLAGVGGWGTRFEELGRSAADASETPGPEASVPETSAPLIPRADPTRLLSAIDGADQLSEAVSADEAPESSESNLSPGAAA